MKGRQVAISKEASEVVELKSLLRSCILLLLQQRQCSRLKYTEGAASSDLEHIAKGDEVTVIALGRWHAPFQAMRMLYTRR